jgi:hypothetical protein
MRKAVAGYAALVCVAVLVLTVRAAPGDAATPPPTARKIPGITATDTYPHGCVDCHLNDPEQKRDTRFRTLLSRWAQGVDPALLARAQGTMPAGTTLKGKHPPALSSLQSVPGKCLPCHGKTSRTAPPFAALMHAIHLGDGQETPFLSVFQGECTHCHKLDRKTGIWSTPSTAEK